MNFFRQDFKIAKQRKFPPHAKRNTKEFKAFLYSAECQRLQKIVIINIFITYFYCPDEELPKTLEDTRKDVRI